MSPAPANPTRRIPAWLIAAALFFLTFGVFSRVVGPGYEFVNYDDPDYVTRNAEVQAGLGPAGVRWAWQASIVSNWHPLTWLSHMADASLFGQNPRGHHATSVVLHALNAALAFAALRRLTGALWTSALCAALFAWHPLRAESVAWVAERKDVLSGFFWFAALWAYAGYAERRRNAARGAGLFYGAALASFALGLLAKPMLVTLPCVLLILDVWPLRRVGFGASRGPADPKPESPTRLIVEKLPFFALAAASSVITYQVQKHGGSVSLALGFDARLANALVSLVRYIGKFLWPFDLAVLYPHPGHWPQRKIVACAVILAGITAVALWQRRRRPWLLLGWLWFVGTLVPVLGLVQVGLQSMADRYTYLPIVGLQIAGLWTVRSFIKPDARRVWAAVAGAVLLACAARTWNQLGVWQNSLTLFDHAIAVTENNYLAYNNRGIYLGEKGRNDEAAADYRRSLAIRPDYANASNNLGRLVMQQGNPADAIPLLRAAVAAEPEQVEAHNNLANALSDAGQLVEAMEHYEFILARQPRHVDALTNSGVTLAMQGKLPEARQRIESALRIDPVNLSATSNLGNVLAMLGQPDAALAQYRRAIALAPNDSRAYHNVGNVLSQQDKLAEAAENYARAVAAAPNNAESRAQLGLTYARLGRRDEALRELRAAVALRPDYAQAKAWLQAVEQGK